MTFQPRAIVCFALVALLGAAGMWLDAPYDPLWRIAALLLVAAVFVEYVVAHSLDLKVTIEQEGIAHLGRMFTGTMTVSNLNSKPIVTRFGALPPISLTGAVTSKDTKIAPNSDVSLQFGHTAEQLGSWTWPHQPVQVLGLFGLANWLRSLPPTGDHTTKVEPDVLPLSRSNLATSGLGQRQVARRNSSGTEFHSLRPYTTGDDASLINWKASARANELIVRDTQLEQQLIIYFVVDCGSAGALRTGSLSALSHAVNVSARLSQIADHAGDRYGLLAYADDIVTQLRPGRGLEHHMEFRRKLSQLNAQEIQANPLTATLALQQNLPRRALILLFTHLDDAEASSQLADAVRLLRPRHLPIVVAIEDPAVRALVSREATDELKMFESLAAQEYRRSVDQSKLRLERLGANIIEAVPEKIEDAVFERYRTLRARHQI